ncbi:MAG: peptidylprolyl isomerase [Sphingomonas fennica]
MMRSVLRAATCSAASLGVPLLLPWAAAGQVGPRYVPINPAAGSSAPAPVPASPPAPAGRAAGVGPDNAGPAVLPAPPAPAPPAPGVTAAARPSLADILAAAPAAAWSAIPADRLLVMTLAGGGRVTIALAPELAPVHVANIVALAGARWWDGSAVTRVQDNYVVQWGGAAEGKPLPPGVVARPPAEYDRPAAGLPFTPLPFADSYAPAIGLSGAFPIAADGTAAWGAHCYGMVGVGRDNAPDTGDGTELYAIIGQAPRHLDRNLAVVGRVVEGMPLLSARPRGPGALGFYTDPADRLGIVSVRLASDLPEGERPVIETLRPDSPSFAAWVRLRANRQDAFFVRPAGALDICQALPPGRTGPAAPRATPPG